MNRRDFFRRTAAAAVVAPAVAKAAEVVSAPAGGGIQWEPRGTKSGYYVTRLISGPTHVSIGIRGSNGEA